MTTERLYPPSLEVEDGAGRLKVYTFGGIPRREWNKIRAVVAAMPEVAHVGGSFEEGAAMWVTVNDMTQWSTVDPRIIAQIRQYLPATVETKRIAFRGYHV